MFLKTVNCFIQRLTDKRKKYLVKKYIIPQTFADIV